MDPDRATPGRKVVRELSFALIDAMEKASRAGPFTAAQLVACECITFAENKVHLSRELIGKCVENAGGEKRRVLAAVYAEIKTRETGSFDYFHEWCRQLWAEALGVHETPSLVQQDQYRNTAAGVTASGKQREEFIGMSRIESFP